MSVADQRRRAHAEMEEALQLDDALSQLHRAPFDEVDAAAAGFAEELEVARWLSVQAGATIEEPPHSALVALRAGVASGRGRAERQQRRRAVAILASMAAMFGGVVIGIFLPARGPDRSVEAALVRADASLATLQSQVHQLETVVGTGDPAQVRFAIANVQSAITNAQQSAQAVPDTPARDQALEAANKEITDLRALLDQASVVASQPSTTLPPTTLAPTTTVAPTTTSTSVVRTTTTQHSDTTTTSSTTSTTATTVVPTTEPGGPATSAPPRK